MKKISIIVPVHNTQQYLERCLNSIFAQTYKNLEVICINDGSTDTSGEILDRMSVVESRLIVVHQQEKGVAAARNKGLKIASGDYIGFVDSDDYISENMYERLTEELEKSGSDFVTCNYFIDYGNRIKENINKKEIPDRILSNSEMLAFVYERDIYPGVRGYLWTKLIRKEIIKKDEDELKICFREDFDNVGEDVFFIAELHLIANKVKYVKESYYYYYQREDSIVHDTDVLLKTMGWAKVYEQTIALYEKHKVAESIINLVKRMYVYKCGVFLERTDNAAKRKELQEMIRKYLSVYMEANEKYLDRIAWINRLLD